MADNKQAQAAAATPAAATNAGPAAGAAAGDGANTPINTAEYKKSQARVRELIEKRRLLERRLVWNYPSAIDTLRFYVSGCHTYDVGS